MAFGRPLVLVLFLHLLLSSQSLEFDARKKHQIRGPIKTLVILVMENRSFDHMLGWLKSLRPDIDGLDGSESNPLNASEPASPAVSVSRDAIFIDSDPGHSFQAIREQIFGSNDTSADPAPMNGFAQQAEGMAVGMSKTVMSGFDPALLPVYSALAQEFAIFDRWFASVPASTQPNRFYVHSATSHGATSNVRKDLIHGFPQKTIFDSLDENGLSFGIYYQNIPATLFFKSLRKLKHVLKFHNYRLMFKLHAKWGRLPNYAVIEQRYFDVSLTPANDDHPSHDVALGQKLVKEVYETLRASPQWNESALLITYDEHGGFYDHVPTPVSGIPNPDGIIGPDPFYFRFDRLGIRVPTILVSPWIEKGTGEDISVVVSTSPLRYVWMRGKQGNTGDFPPFFCLIFPNQEKWEEKPWFPSSFLAPFLSFFSLYNFSPRLPIKKINKKYKRTSQWENLPLSGIPYPRESPKLSPHPNTMLFLLIYI